MACLQVWPLSIRTWIQLTGSDGQITQRTQLRSQQAKKDTTREWITFKTVPWTKEVSWPGKTLILFQMIKRLVFGVAAGALALAPLSARADWFVNPEINIGVGTETGVGGAVTDLHVGYEFKNGAYAQMGPSLVTPDTGDSEIELSGKAGISGGPIYTEVSFSTGDTETTGNIKVGGRF